jgi:hypothetical protein
MLRLIVLILFVVVLWLVLEGAMQGLRRFARGPARRGTVPPRQARTEVAGEELVRCAACGVHIPRSRALVSSGTPEGSPVDLYCSDSCRRSSPLAS